MRIAIKLVLLAFAALLGLTLDYSLAAKAAGENYDVLRHVKVRLAGLEALMPAPALAKALPAAPQGWTARAVKETDSFLILGQTPTQVQLANVRKIEDAMQESIKGMQTARRFYQRGEEMIYLDITFVPANAKGTKGARLSSSLFGLYAARAGGPINSEAGAFAVRRYQTKEMGLARMYFAVVGEQVYLSALSNAADPSTLEVLNGVDHAALSQMISDDPTINAPAVVEKADPGKGVPGKAQAEAASGCVTRGAAKFCTSAGN